MQRFLNTIAAASLVLGASITTAQVTNPGQGGGIGGGNNQNQFPGGILINPEGVIGSLQSQKVNPRLEQKRLRLLADRNLPTSLVQPSELRFVSLAGINAACREAIESGHEIPQHVRYLGGITQIRYLIAAPENGDILLAGPAEGFAALQGGRMVGTETGRPVLVLDDLLTMLRLPNMNTSLGCSFDPDPSRLAQAQAWNKANSSPASAPVARQRFFQMANVLGNWNITTFGLPETSHAAVTTVEADYQLKRITLGLDRPGIRGFLSHLDMARPGENTMRRWWFAPRYKVIEQSTDGLMFQLKGPRLQLLSQEELVDTQGNRSDAAFTEVSAERYTKQFNKHITELCKRVPSFAAIQNIFDIAVVAAIIRKHDLVASTGIAIETLTDAEAMPLQSYTVPTEVPSLANVKAASRGLLIGLIGGGVTIVPNRVISRSNEIPTAEIPEVPALRNSSAFWMDK